MAGCEIYSGIKRPIDSFIKYFKNTKPYHTKILEVLERYNFFDNIDVSIPEDILKTITFSNKPLCSLTGWGVDWDNECGFDALSCCDLFDCIGGFGLIYNNSDLLVSVPIDTLDINGTITVDGNYTYDQKLPILNIISNNSLSVVGNKTALFANFKLFLIIPKHVYPIVSISSGNFQISGNAASEFISRQYFSVYGSDGNDKPYTVTSAYYNTATNLSTINVAETIANIGGNGFIEIKSVNKNNGVYQVQSSTFNGVNTIVTISPSNSFKILNDTTHGSIQFRSGLIYPRNITLSDSSANNDGDYRIVLSTYDYVNGITVLTLADTFYDVSSLKASVNLYGYEFPAGFDADAECTIPKPANVHALFSERLQIRVLPLPTPTPTMTPTNPEATYTPTPTPLPISPTPTPTMTPSAFFSVPRIGGAAALLTSGKVIIAGGDNGIDFVSTSEFYNPITDRFETGPNMTSAREAFTMTMLNDGTFLIAGGSILTPQAINLAEIYDPLSNTFTPTNGNMAAPRSNHTATLLPSGKVLLTGGLDASAAVVNTAELYDPITGLFSFSANVMSSNRSQHTATLLNDGTVLIVGGTNGLAVQANGEIYTPGTDSFLPTDGVMNSPREYHTATLLPDGTVLITGGYDAVAISNTAEIYDPNASNYNPTGNMTTTRWSHNATMLLDGTVLITGGADNSNAVLNTAEVYDPISGTFTATDNNMVDARESHTTTLLQNGKVLAAGGFNGIGAVATADIYDPITGDFTPTLGLM